MPGASAAGPCADGTQAAPADAPVIEVREIVTRFGTQTVHDGVSFAIDRGTLVALIGGSGTGKSVLLREIMLDESDTWDSRLFNPSRLLLSASLSAA